MIRARTISVAAVGAAVMAVTLAGCSGEGSGRRTGIWSAGSSTVFPFATRVAENFGRNNPGMSSPRVEALGTGGGIKAFCQGVGPTTPDIANASRPMKASEFDECAKNGVTDIIELKIGYDGIVVATARSGNSFNFELNDLYEGLAREVPDASGAFIINPKRTWQDVNPGLPSQRIQVYGPPPTSGTRDAFLELGMTPGAKLVPAAKALSESDKERFEAIAHTIREDNAWIDSGENDNAILQTLTRTPGSLGVFGFSFLEQNLDTVKAETIDGVAPSAASIADGSYPLARSLYIYVKKAHIGVIPGLRQYLQEFMSDSSAGRGGYLQDRGLVPLPEAELAHQRAVATQLTTMSRPAK
jgi:phosphate transport system substrate-binding protein